MAKDSPHPVLVTFLVLIGALFAGGPTPEPASIITFPRAFSSAPSDLTFPAPGNASFCLASDYLTLEQDFVAPEQCHMLKSSAEMTSPANFTSTSSLLASLATSTVILIALACCARCALTAAESSARVGGFFGVLLCAERRTRPAFTIAYIALGAFETQDWVNVMPSEWQSTLTQWEGFLTAALAIIRILYNCCYLGTDDAISALTQEAVSMERELRQERAENASNLTHIEVLEKCTNLLCVRGLELVTKTESQAQSLSEAAKLKEASTIALSEARARISELENEVEKTTRIYDKFASDNRMLRVNNLLYKNADIDVKAAREETVNANNQVGALADQNEKLATKVTDLERQLVAQKGTFDKTNEKLATKVTDLERQLAAQKGTFDTTNEKLATKVTDLERQLAAQKGTFDTTNEKLATKVTDLERQLAALRSEKGIFEKTCLEQPTGINSQQPTETSNLKNDQKLDPREQIECNEGVDSQQDAGNSLSTGSGHSTEAQTSSKPRVRGIKKRNQKRASKLRDSIETSDGSSDIGTCASVHSDNRNATQTEAEQKMASPTESSDLRRETDEADQVPVKLPERKVAKAFSKRKRNTGTTSIAPRAVCFYRPHDEYGTRYPCVNGKESKCCGNPSKYDDQGREVDGGLEDAEAVKAGICMACYFSKCIDQSDDLDSDDPNAEVCYYQDHGEKGETHVCGNGKKCCGDPGQYDHSGKLIPVLPGSTVDENLDEAIEREICFFCYLSTFCYFKPHEDDQIYRCNGSGQGGDKGCCGDPSRYDGNGELRNDRTPPGWSQDAQALAAQYIFCVECYLEQIAHLESEEE